MGRQQVVDERQVVLDEVREQARQAGLLAAEHEVARAVAAHELARQRLDAATAALEAAARRLLDHEHELTTSIEDAAVHFAIQVAEEILGRELRACDNPVVEAIGRAARLTPERGTVVLRMHPDDIEIAGAGLPGVPGLGDRCEIVADPTVGRGGCIAVVGPLRIDAQIPAALERVRAVLGE